MYNCIDCGSVDDTFTGKCLVNSYEMKCARMIFEHLDDPKRESVAARLFEIPYQEVTSSQRNAAREYVLQLLYVGDYND